jgi:hypothetical protein
MSKQSDAKEAQGYTRDPLNCSTCKHFTSEIEQVHSYGHTYSKETNLRCGIGGFAVKKMDRCNRWEKMENK